MYCIYFAYNKYLDDRNFDYGLSRDEVSDNRYDQEWELTNKGVAYEQAMDFLNLGIMPSDEILAQAGLSPAEATAYLVAKGFGTGTSSSGSTGSGSSKTSSYNADQKNYARYECRI